MATPLMSSQRTYLKINKDGILYQSSKEPKEGYVEVKWGDDNQNTSYHKLYSSTESGQISFIGIREIETSSAKMKMFSIGIKNGDVEDVISLPLKTTRGGLNDYVKNLATILPNMKFENTFTIYPSRDRNDKGYLNKRFFIKDETNNAFLKSKHKYGADGDIPQPVIKEGMDGKVYDRSEQDKYLYDILTAQIDRFKEFVQNKPASVETASDVPIPSMEKPVPVSSVDTPDDLPF